MKNIRKKKNIGPQKTRQTKILRVSYRVVVVVEKLYVEAQSEPKERLDL